MGAKVLKKNTLCVDCIIPSVSMKYFFTSPDLYTNQHNFRLLTSNFHVCVPRNVKLRRSGMLELCVCFSTSVEDAW